MNNALINLFSSDLAALPLSEVLLNFLAAVVLSLIVYVSYSMTHGSADYSAKFNKYLAMIAPITALIINVIGGGIGISLAVLGIFSILRINQSFDIGKTAYILWSIAIGICCGVRQYTIAVVGSSVIFVFAAILENVRENESYILVINGSLENMQFIEDIVANVYFNKIKLKAKKANSHGVEYIYYLPETIMDNDKSIRLEKLLCSTEGVYIRFIRQSENNT